MLKNDANSVRKISKDIYVIKNDINLKVYVGQSVDSKKRFESHCKKNKDNSLIDKAIQKYGKEHFWYEVLEEKIQNYNEREKYWIKNTIAYLLMVIIFYRVEMNLLVSMVKNLLKAKCLMKLF